MRKNIYTMTVPLWDGGRRLAVVDVLLEDEDLLMRFIKK